ncbi:MAG: hypothetical protein EA380_08530 [Phycisphaeraceae bacterium]|nr:MAG: hypothetical protein EA380_08530 [Phycisphaeraceae bacterium]
MLVTLSPYDLTAHAPSVMAGLLLADETATVVPAPMHEHDPTADETDATGEMQQVAFLLECWRWTAPLWQGGVLSPGLGGIALLTEVERVREEIMRMPEETALRRILERFHRTDDSERFYDAVSRDFMRAGTEPGVSVPIAVALERFAIATGSLLARAPAASVTERLEERGVTGLLSLTVPCVMGASGEGLLIMRDLLAGVLDDLRGAIDEGVDLIRSGGHEEDLTAMSEEVLAPAARGFHEGFRAERSSIMHAEGDDCRPMMALLTIGTQPSGTALGSAMRAAGALLPTRASAGRLSRGVGQPAPMATPNPPESGLALSSCLTLSVKLLPWDV